VEHGKFPDVIHFNAAVKKRHTGKVILAGGLWQAAQDHKVTLRHWQVELALRLSSRATASRLLVALVLQQCCPMKTPASPRWQQHRTALSSSKSPAQPIAHQLTALQGAN
jgi:hypothetical protein